MYARVSTSDQNVAQRLDEAHDHLESLGVEEVKKYPEIIFGAAETDTCEVSGKT